VSGVNPAASAERGAIRSRSFLRLIVHNLATRKARTLLTAAAVAISVMAIVTLNVVTQSLQESAASVLQTGQADFTVAQKGAPDTLDSVVTDVQAERIAATPGVASAVGSLVATTNLGASRPFFLRIGVAPSALAPFGVKVVAGRAYGPTASDEMMLGWQAAEDLGMRVGDSMTIDRTRYRVVGIYSIRQVFGDAASMFPLVPLQASERKPGTVTLVAVKVRPGASIERVRQRIEAENPNLATVRLASEFGRVDRNFAFLKAAQTGATIIALVIGIIIVMNTMLLSFIERIREFGLLRSVGWTRRRLLALVIGEALGISLLGAAAGVALSFGLIFALSAFSSLRGLLQPEFSSGIFWTALYSAISIGLIAALYPSARAAVLRPGVALRRE
jgi:putative ABC transport system permease protein